MLKTLLILSFLFITPVHAAKNPCLLLNGNINADGQKLVDDFEKLQENFSKKEMMKFKDRLEKYLHRINTVLENFNLDDFMHDRLMTIIGMKEVDQETLLKLKAAFQPYFNSKKLPTLAVFRQQLEEEFKTLPLNQIYLVLEESFKAWKTKIIFDESGQNKINRLAKQLVDKGYIDDFIFDAYLMGKNDWVGYFEGDKERVEFAASIEAIVKNQYGQTEIHESGHMFLQFLASQGHLSPMHIHFVMDKKFKKTGALGKIQKSLLTKATKKGEEEESDFYRLELYAEELFTHRAETRVQGLSKILSEIFSEHVQKVAPNSTSLKMELWELYAEFIRSERGEGIHFERYSEKAQKAFSKILNSKLSDFGNTGIATSVNNVLSLLSSDRQIAEGMLVGIKRARTVVMNKIEAKEKIAAIKDSLLKKAGYAVPIKIPVDVRLKDGTWVQKEGMTIKFRFTGMAPYSPFLDPAQEALLLKQIDWSIRTTEEAYAIIKNINRPRTVRDALMLQDDLARLSKLDHKLIADIENDRY